VRCFVTTGYDSWDEYESRSEYGLKNECDSRSGRNYGGLFRKGEFGNSFGYVLFFHIRSILHLRLEFFVRRFLRVRRIEWRRGP
jgi:hypothetical protein